MGVGGGEGVGSSLSGLRVLAFHSELVNIVHHPKNKLTLSQRRVGSVVQHLQVVCSIDTCAEMGACTNVSIFLVQSPPVHVFDIIL